MTKKSPSRRDNFILENCLKGVRDNLTLRPNSRVKGITRKTRTCLSLALGLLIFAGASSLAQTQGDCQLSDDVTPPAGPRVTAQQVEDGNASLTDFALTARDRWAALALEFQQESITVEQWSYVGCLLRQEGGPWRSGSTYLVQLAPDGRVFTHAKDMLLSARQLKPVIYGAILHAVGIDPADLTDPAKAQAAFTAAAGDGGPFNVPDVPGASGYAIVLPSEGVFQLAGFDLGESHLVPISDEAIDYGDPAVTAGDVVGRATLKAFVTAAGEYLIELLEAGDLVAAAKARIGLRDPNGPWRHGPVYLTLMERVSKRITFHGAFPDRFEMRYGGIARDVVTGELIVDQLIAAAESGPEGGFWQYHFDNPDDDTDSVDIPKVGYARVVTVHFPLPDGSAVPFEYIIQSGFYLSPDSSRP